MTLLFRCRFKRCSASISIKECDNKKLFDFYETNSYDYFKIKDLKILTASLFKELNENSLNSYKLLNEIATVMLSKASIDKRTVLSSFLQ